MSKQTEIGIRKVEHKDTQRVKNITDYTSSLQVQPFVTFTKRRLETVITPSKLCFALADLTDAQSAAIKSMGFESIKYMNISAIPAALGYWLLTNYDHRYNTLNVGKQRIEITPAIVRDILGVPMGANKVKEGVKTMDYKNVYLAEWERQFGSNLKGVSLRQVIQAMMLQEDGGWLFKLNFLVVFNTIMGETTDDSTLNTRFLTSIKRRTDIANMDWCSYIITCLKRTKKEWNGVGNYNGPLTLLAVVYAHHQLLRHTPTKAKTPAIQYVTTELLLELESNLYKVGDVFKTYVDGTGKDHTDAGTLSKSLVEAEQTQQNEQMGDDSTHQRDIICVQGYKVKPDMAPILEAISQEHEDIAGECVFKTDEVRSSFLEVVMLIKTDNVIDRMEDIEPQLLDAKAANINVSWLQAQLEAIKA